MGRTLVLNCPRFDAWSDSTGRWDYAGSEEYPQELRERALRLVDEAMAEDPSLSINQAVIRIGEPVGVVARDTP
jgi:hypothetical protein